MLRCFEWQCSRSTARVLMPRWPTVHRNFFVVIQFFFQKLPPKCQTGPRRNRPPLTHVSTAIQFKRSENKEITLVLFDSLKLGLSLSDACVCRVHAHFLCFPPPPPTISPPILVTVYLSRSFFYDYTILVCVLTRVCVNKLQPIFWSKANDGIEKMPF